MNKYVLLIRNVGNPMEGLSESEIQDHMNAWGVWMGKLGQDGHLTDGLPFSSNAAVISQGDKVTETLHLEANGLNVGGYLILKSESLNHAIELSKGCPALGNPTSTIEVRECMEMN